MQCVQSIPTATVAISPKTYPPYLKANGIAKMPMPSEPFTR